MSLRWGDAARLATKGGAADRLRRGLVAGCAALAVIPAVGVAGIAAAHHEMDRSSGYGLGFLWHVEPAWGAGTAMVLLMLPVALLAVECARVGSAPRDRRLAAVRAAGGTSRDVRRIVQVETLLMSAVGAVVGVPAALGLWGALPTVVVSGGPLMPSGVWPEPLHVVGAVVAVALAAGLLSPLAVRRVSVGVDGQLTRDRRVSLALPTTLLLVACLAVAGALQGSTQGAWVVVVGALVVVAVTSGTFALVGIAPVVTTLLGGVLSRSGDAATMLAGRGMRGHPRMSGRAGSGLVLVGLLGGLIAVFGGSLRAGLHQMAASGAQAAGGGNAFYLVPLLVAEVLVVVVALLGGVGLVVGIAEHVVARRAGLARYIASGVPRRLLRRALVIQVTVPVAAISLISMAIGGLASGVFVGAGWAEAGSVHVDWWLLVTLVLAVTMGAAGAAWVGSGRLLGVEDVRQLRDS